MIKTLITFFILLNLELASANQFDQMETIFTNELKTQLNQLPVRNLKPEFTTMQNELLNGIVNDSVVNEDETHLELSRINLMFAAFTEIDFKIIEIKIQPYIEFRFNKK